MVVMMKAQKYPVRSSGMPARKMIVMYVACSCAPMRRACDADVGTEEGKFFLGAKRVS